MSPSADPTLTASIYPVGRLDGVLGSAVAPFLDAARQVDEDCYLWFLRYPKRGEHLKLRIHSRPEHAADLKHRITTALEGCLAEPVETERRELRPSALRAPAIDPEDADPEPVRTPALVWSTYRRDPLSLGSEPLLSDSTFVELLTRCLARGSEWALARLSPIPRGRVVDLEATTLLAHGIAGASTTAGLAGERLLAYLRYHRDTLVRHLIRQHRDPFSKAEQLLQRFDRRAEAATVVLAQMRQVMTDWRGDDEPALLAGWRGDVGRLMTYLGAEGAHLLEEAEPFAERGLFQPLFRLLHGFSNQLGIDRLNEALIVHYMARALGVPIGDRTILVPSGGVAIHPSGTLSEEPGAYPLIVRVGGLPATAVRQLGEGRFETLAREELETEARLEQARALLVDHLYEQIPRIAAELRPLVLKVKRDAFNGRPLVRHRSAEDWGPVLEVGGEVLRRVLELEEHRSGLAREGQRLFRDRQVKERRAVLRWIDDPGARRGMGLASPELVRHLGRLRRKPPERWGRKERSLESSVVRYLARSALQLSPFSTLTRVGLAVAHPTGPRAPRLGPGQWHEQSLVQVRRNILDRFAAVLLRIPAIRGRLAISLNETLEEIEPGRYRYFRPGYWKVDEEAMTMAEVLPAIVRVSLSGAMITWFLEHLAGEEIALTELLGLLEEQFAEGTEAAVRERTVEKLIGIGFLQLRPPWGSDALFLEPRLLECLETAARSAPNDHGLDSAIHLLRNLIETTAGFATSPDPVAIVRGSRDQLEELWNELATLAGIDPAVRWQPEAKTVLCEDVFLRTERGDEGEGRHPFPSRIAEISRATAQELLDSLEPLVRLSTLFERQYDFLATLSDFAREPWPEGGELPFATFFEAAQPLWRDYTRFEAALRREGQERGPKTYDPRGLELLARVAERRKAIWNGLAACGRDVQDGRRIDPQALGALLDTVPEPWGSLRDATFFVQPATVDGELWVLNTFYEGLRYGCRYTAVMEPEQRSRYIDFFRQRSTTLHDGEPVELVDVLCPSGRGVNIHSVLTPRALVLPGEPCELAPEQRITLDQLRVELPRGRGPFKLRDGAGRRIAPIYLGTTMVRFMPLLLKFLTLFGPGKLDPSVPEVASQSRDDHLVQGRLYCGQVVVRRRRWLVSPQKVTEVWASVSEPEGFLALQNWRQSRGIPPQVFIARRTGGDVTKVHYKPQYVDFTSPLSVALFRAAIEGFERDWICLEEVLPQPEAGLDHGSDAVERWAFEMQLDSFPGRHAKDSFWNSDVTVRG